MSNTGQTDRGFNGEYHHDINLLLTHQEYDADTIHSLKSQVEFEKGLARIKRDEYAKRIAELEKELITAEQRIADQLKLIEVAGKRIAELENQVEFEMNGKGLARIKRNEYAKRVNDLEIRIDDLKRGLDKIFKVVSSFNGGLTPVGCDGVIMLKVDEYNSLVSAINTAE